MSLFNTSFTSFFIKSGTTFNNTLIRVFSALVSPKILLISRTSEFKIKEFIGNSGIFLFSLILLPVIILGSIFPLYL
jgi:hypothetical protein